VGQKMDLKNNFGAREMYHHSNIRGKKSEEK
jgi:hypothetical protein